MTAVEYDLLDELYFVTAYADVADTISIPESELNLVLTGLIHKGYVKCFYPNPDTEVEFDAVAFKSGYSGYYFLATKAGLIAHNSR